MMASFEIEIEQEKQEAAEKSRKLERNLPFYMEQIDKRLEQDKVEELLELFQEKEVRELARLDNTMAVFSIILSIYQMEAADGVSPKILDGICNMKEAEAYYLKGKFLMWRLEFQGDKQELAAFIKEHQVSLPFLKYLIHTSSFEKVNTAFKLAMLLKEEGHFGQAFGMLNYVNELSPDEEIVFCEMADICIQNRQYQTAADCIGRIQHPSQILAGYQQRWGI